MKIHKIEAGSFKVDGGAVFGVVPKKVWQKRYACDDENFCPVNMRCMLIETGNRKVIIDTGTGNKQLDYLKYYDFHGVIDFEAELNNLGYTCSDITDVILTHLHFDHCGGCTYYTDDYKKQISLTFPNALHHVATAQWDNYLNPNVREGDSYFPENMMPVFQASKLNLVDENMFLSNEIELRIFNGHTQGHIAVYIHTPNQTIVYAGDVIPLMANIPLAWVSAYDTNPVLSMKEKEMMLKEAFEKKQILFFEHDALNECCDVVEVNGRLKAGNSYNLKEILN